jgi:TetR/AcrR family transcriptional regulator, cholesterol catabolism regulator
LREHSELPEPLVDDERPRSRPRSPYTHPVEKKRSAVARKPRAMDSEARWEEIVHAAASIFYQKGYEATSLQDIASAVGLLKGSIYYYIKTKEDLLYEIVNRAQMIYMGTLEEEPEATGADAPERLRAFIHRWMALTAKEREWGLVAEREFSRLSPRRLKIVIGRRDQYSDFVKEILAQGVREGAFDPGVDISVATTAIFELMISSRQWHRPTGRLSLLDIGDWYATFVVRGLGGPRWSTSQPA